MTVSGASEKDRDKGRETKGEERGKGDKGRGTKIESPFNPPQPFEYAFSPSSISSSSLTNLLMRGSRGNGEISRSFTGVIR
jgi:hypothetical protein